MLIQSHQTTSNVQMMSTMRKIILKKSLAAIKARERLKDQLGGSVADDAMD